MKMTKKELVQLYREGKLKTTAQSIEGFQIVEVIYGFEDKVFGFFQFADKAVFSLVKIHYSVRAYFVVQGQKIYLDECIKY
jgi:hypothetical protein